MNRTLILLCCIFIAQLTTAQCSTTNAHNASTFANDNTVGVISFSSPGNAALSDNNRSSASAIITILSGNTHYLKASNFQFAIPTAAGICGIQVEVEKSASNISLLAWVTDNSIRLVKGGNATGDNYASPGAWTNTDDYYSYGGVNDLWGTTWTPEEVNDADFGIAFSAHINGLITLLPSARIDHIRVTVFFNLVLPVPFTNFTVRPQDQSNLLQWTNEEKGLVTIERSINSKDWTTIATTSNDSYTDPTTAPVSYYRLKLKDQMLYSDIVRVNQNSQNNFNVYPNPSKENLFIEFKETIYHLQCVSSDGRLHELRYQKTGTNKYKLDISSLLKGIYILVINEKSGLFFKE